MTVPGLVLSLQLNYRYMVHDSCLCSLARAPVPSDPEFGNDVVTLDSTIRNRAVPTTGSTFLAVTLGISLNVGALTDQAWAKTMQVYFFPQVPVARDFNGNLAQGLSFMGGVTKYFSFSKS